MHKPGFKHHWKILYELFRLVRVDNALQTPLWDANKENYANNKEYVGGFVKDLLISSFPNLMPQQVDVN